MWKLITKNKYIMAESLKSKLKGLPKKEKFFGILSYVLSEDIDETTKLSQVVKDLDSISEKPIMKCEFTHDLGMDSLDVFEVCFQCQEVFNICQDIDIDMDTLTVQGLWDIVNQHGKGD